MSNNWPRGRKHPVLLCPSLRKQNRGLTPPLAKRITPHRDGLRELRRAAPLRLARPANPRVGLGPHAMRDLQVAFGFLGAAEACRTGRPQAQRPANAPGVVGERLLKRLFRARPRPRASRRRCPTIPCTPRRCPTRGGRSRSWSRPRASSRASSPLPRRPSGTGSRPCTSHSRRSSALSDFFDLLKLPQRIDLAPACSVSPFSSDTSAA